MRKYKVWSETYDQNEAGSHELWSNTPQMAAETWARWFDDGVGDLEIINGKPATVAVKDIETGHVSTWFVRGESVPVYTAKLRVSDGAIP